MRENYNPESNREINTRSTSAISEKLSMESRGSELTAVSADVRASATKALEEQKVLPALSFGTFDSGTSFIDQNPGSKVAKIDIGGSSYEADPRMPGADLDRAPKYHDDGISPPLKDDVQKMKPCVHQNHPELL